MVLLYVGSVAVTMGVMIEDASLLLDAAIRGQTTRFARQDGVEESWRAGTRGLGPRDLAMNVALPEIARVLRPGGHVVVLTPNVNCHCHERYRSAWFSLQAPFHLVLFTPEAMTTAFEKAGFTVTHGGTSSRRAMVHNIGSLDLRDSTGGLPSFDGQVPVGRLVRGLGAQISESARIALGRDAGEELVFVGQKR